MNLKAQENYEQRLIDVEWEDNNTTKEYTAHIDIYGLNRSGLLNDVLQVLSNTTKNISTVNTQPTKDMKFANIHVFVSPKVCTRKNAVPMTARLWPSRLSSRFARAF